MKNLDTAKILRRVAIITMIANVLLFTWKLVMSLLFPSAGVTADAIHSAADIFTGLTIIIVSFFISEKPDKKHNYGHERIEALFTLVLSFVVAVVSLILIWEGINGIIEPSSGEISNFAIVTVVVSLVAKECMFWYGIYNARRIKSEMLRVTAWHNRADGLSSVAVLLGLIFSKLTHNNIFESIAVIIVGLLIVKVAVEIFIEASNQLIDRAVDETTVNKITAVVMAVPGVKNVVEIKTRLFGSKTNLDIVITVDKKLTVVAGDKIADSVEQKILTNTDINVKYCTVHVKPN